MKKLEIIMFIVLITQSGYDAGGETYTEFVQRNLQQLCPYTNFCSQNATKSLNENDTACCQPCSCDVTCERRGNCCPDYKLATETTQQTETDPCMSVVEKNTTQEGVWFEEPNGINSDANFYPTVASCPSEFEDWQTISRCTSPVPHDFVDVVRVSDENGRVYRNQNCAICNGVTDYITWELQLVYSEFNNAEDFTKLDVVSLLNMGFQFKSLSPAIHTDFLSRCFIPEFIGCNQTGDWAVFDHHTYMACESFTNIFFKEDAGQVSLYKNPFCYICNTDRRASYICNDLGGKNWVQKFAALIDVGATDEKRSIGDREGKHVCRREEIYDPYFDVCRKLACPIGAQPTYGQCLNRFKTSSRLSMKFQIATNISSTQTGNFSRDSIVSPSIIDVGIISHAVLNNAGINGTACIVCSAKLYMHVEGYPGIEHLLLIDIGTSDHCTVDDILDLMQSNLNQSFLAFVDNQNVTMATTLEFPLQSSSDVIQLTSAYWTQADIAVSCMPGVLITDPKFYCPNIGLSNEEYLQYTSGNVTHVVAPSTDFKAAKVQSEQGEGHMTVNRICIKDYLVKTKSPVSSTRGCMQMSWMLMSTFAIITGCVRM